MYSASLANICMYGERQTFCHHQEEEEVLANLANASFWHTTTPSELVLTFISRGQSYNTHQNFCSDKKIIST